MKSLFVAINGCDIDRINKICQYSLENDISNIYFLTGNINDLDTFIKNIPEGLKYYVFLDKRDSYGLSFDKCLKVLNGRRDIYIITSCRNEINYYHNKIVLVNDLFDKDSFIDEDFDNYKLFYITKDDELTFDGKKDKFVLISVPDEKSKGLIFDLEKEIKIYSLNFDDSKLEKLL